MVVLLRPSRLLGGRIDEPNVHADRGPTLLDVPLEQGIGAEQRTDLSHPLARANEGSDGALRNDPKSAEVRQCGAHLLGDPIRQILLSAVAANEPERQDSETDATPSSGNAGASRGRVHDSIRHSRQDKHRCAGEQ